MNINNTTSPPQKMVKKVNLKIEPPVISNDSYSLTTSGTFKEGDLLINKKGLLIKGESPKNSSVNDRNKTKTLHSNLNPQNLNQQELNDNLNQQYYSSNNTINNNNANNISSNINTPTTNNTPNNFNNITNINTPNNSESPQLSGLSISSPTSTSFPSQPSFNYNNNNNNSDLSIRPSLDINKNNRPQYDSNLPLDLKDLTIIRILGRGAGGVVKLAYHSTLDTYIALKVITLDIQENVRKQIILELKTLHKTYCPYIVSFYDAFYTEGSIFIALEYMDLGSLSDLMKKSIIIPEPVLGKIAYQVLQGLTYLHRKLHLIHRDIKPSNILINKQFDAKIADFGVSGQLQHTLSKAVTWVGTVTYMSPERISGRSYSFDSDIWSLGLTILECATGKFPYSGSISSKEQAHQQQQHQQAQAQQQQYQQQQQFIQTLDQQQQYNNIHNNSNNSNNVNNIRSGGDSNSSGMGGGSSSSYSNSGISCNSNEGMGFWVLLDCIVKEDVPLLPNSFSKEFRSFISDCLQKEPVERPTASTLLNHEFIKKYQNFNVDKWTNGLRQQLQQQ